MTFLYYVHVVGVGGHGAIKVERLFGPPILFTALFALNGRMAVIIRGQALRHTTLQRLCLLRIQFIHRLFVDFNYVIR